MDQLRVQGRSWITESSTSLSRSCIPGSTSTVLAAPTLTFHLHQTAVNKSIKNPWNSGFELQAEGNTNRALEEPTAELRDLFVLHIYPGVPRVQGISQVFIHDCRFFFKGFLHFISFLSCFCCLSWLFCLLQNSEVCTWLTRTNFPKEIFLSIGIQALPRQTIAYRNGRRK